MPNWCENTITIQGPKALILDIWDKAKRYSEESDVGLLQAMHPMPAALENDEASRDGGLPAWYVWRLDNWGCKWDVSVDGLECSVSDDGQRAMINGFFDTPWGPPVEALEWFAKAHPEVSIDVGYYEGGMAFAGVFSAGSGEVFENEELAIDGFMDIREVPPSLIRRVPMLEGHFEMLADMEVEEHAEAARC